MAFQAYHTPLLPCMSAYATAISLDQQANKAKLKFPDTLQDPLKFMALNATGDAVKLKQVPSPSEKQRVVALTTLYIEEA